MNELRTVLPYFRPYKKVMALGVALVVVANSFSLAGPYLLKLAVDALPPDPGADPRARRCARWPSTRC